MLKKIASCFVSLVLLVALMGCFIPEQFDAKVMVNKDGSYTMAYDGTLTFVMALAAGKKGELNANDEEMLKREGAQLARQPGFKKVEYLGNGRYKVLFEKSGKPGEPLYFLNREMKFFAIAPQRDGTLSVSAILPDKKTMQSFGSLGAKMDGTLTVSVASGAKVIKHNAQSQPTLFGLVGSYKWKIKSPDENPYIVIQPN